MSLIFPYKATLYTLTIASAFFFGFREMKLKRKLTDHAPGLTENVSDMTMFNLVIKDMRREEFLSTFPREMLANLRLAIGLKFLFVALLIIEVLVLQQ